MVLGSDEGWVFGSVGGIVDGSNEIGKLIMYTQTHDRLIFANVSLWVESVPCVMSFNCMCRLSEDS